jgi:hypothetical protein
LVTVTRTHRRLHLSHDPLDHAPTRLTACGDGASHLRTTHRIMLPLASRLVEMEPPTAELRARMPFATKDLRTLEAPLKVG